MTAVYDPADRQESLSTLIAQLLLHEAQSRIVVVALEDAQWFDSASWELLSTISGATKDARILTLISGTCLDEVPHQPCENRRQTVVDLELMLFSGR